MELKSEVLKSIKGHLLKAYEEAVANKNVINNLFLQESILSIINKHCGGTNEVATRIVSKQNRTARSFTAEDFEKKTKPQKVVATGEFDNLSLEELKKVAHTQYGLKTAGKDKDQLIDEINWVKNPPKPKSKKAKKEKTILKYDMDDLVSKDGKEIIAIAKSENIEVKGRKTDDLIIELLLLKSENNEEEK